MYSTCYSCQILIKITLSQQICKIASMYWKNLPVWGELFHADERIDGHTNITKPIFAFRKFSNALQRQQIPYIRITPLFLIYCVFYSFFIWNYCPLCVPNITNIFTELGRFCRYDWSRATLRNVRWWRAYNLLVWNSADTTRKET